MKDNKNYASDVWDQVRPVLDRLLLYLSSCKPDEIEEEFRNIFIDIWCISLAALENRKIEKKLYDLCFVIHDKFIELLGVKQYEFDKRIMRKKVKTSLEELEKYLENGVKRHE